ncbi:MAG: helix-turn-helix transcriptional regulator [Candidatus Lokiarchaeota archaeon]|nr:helix-turn-helix transcriptional regulator [Candidatus Lokiarchaeota archaeon]
MVATRRKRLLVPTDRHKGFYQPQVDHILLILSHPVRAATMEFLSHARLMGEALQPFSNIQHAIDSKKNRLSTSDLDYHLKELKKALLIEQLVNGNKTAGYLLTEKGIALVEKYLEMKNIQVFQQRILEPNVLEMHVHGDRIMALTRPLKQEPHVTCIDLPPFREESAADRYLVDRAREAVEGRPQPGPPRRRPQQPRRDGKDRARPPGKGKDGHPSLDAFR